MFFFFGTLCSLNFIDAIKKRKLKVIYNKGDFILFLFLIYSNLIIPSKS